MLLVIAEIIILKKTHNTKKENFLQFVLLFFVHSAHS